MRSEEVMDVHGATRREVEGKGLPVVVLVDGVFDAGEAVSSMRSVLRENLDVEPLAEFDADLLLDHRATRPRITFSDGGFVDYRAPRLGVDLLTDELGGQALLFSGAEPLVAWERITEAFTSLLDEVRAGHVVIVHSMPLPVPHTRPVTLHRHGDSSIEVSGRMDLPASYAHLLETRLRESGKDVSALTIQVPHYIAESEYPPAAVAGLESVAAETALAVPTEELRESGREIDARIAAQLEHNPEAAQLVAGLETRYDAQSRELPQRSSLLAEGEPMPDGDDIARAAERYLRSVEANPDEIDGSEA